MESNTFVVDSNVFIAFYAAGDEQHADAVAIMRELVGKTLVVHPYVIQEVATVLTYRFGLAVAKKFLADIRNADDVMVPTVDIAQDIERFSSASKKVSFTDITLVGLAISMNTSLLTFDRQMLSLFKKKRV